MSTDSKAIRSETSASLVRTTRQTRCSTQAAPLLAVRRSIAPAPTNYCVCSRLSNSTPHDNEASCSEFRRGDSPVVVTLKQYISHKTDVRLCRKMTELESVLRRILSGWKRELDAGESTSVIVQLWQPETDQGTAVVSRCNTGSP